jgi:RNA polymerase sigma-70 factor (ECF subfamily)
MLAWLSRVSEVPGAEVRHAEVNGQPGGLTLDEHGGLIGVWAIDIADDKIQSMTVVSNPDKLRHIGPLGDLRALLARLGPSPTEDTGDEEDQP